MQQDYYHLCRSRGYKLEWTSWGGGVQGQHSQREAVWTEEKSIEHLKYEDKGRGEDPEVEEEEKKVDDVGGERGDKKGRRKRIQTRGRGGEKRQALRC